MKSNDDKENILEYIENEEENGVKKEIMRNT